MTAIALIRWILMILLALATGKLVSLVKLPSILGWLIAGMIFGPYGLGLLAQGTIDSTVYTVIIDWMQVVVGVMLGTELVWKKLKKSGKGLLITTLTQSLGTFVLVSIVFSIVFALTDTPAWLGLVFGSIALATAPLPALSIVKEFHTKGPVTDTLLPMSVLDDLVGIVVFFSVNAVVTKLVSGTNFPLYRIPLMLLVPIAIGIVTGWLCGVILRRMKGKFSMLAVLLLVITGSFVLSMVLYSNVLSSLAPNYMLVGVALATTFSNMVPEEKLNPMLNVFSPILNISIVVSIVDLGAPLDYHLIVGAGLYTFIYILSRAAGKYFGARFGAKATHMPETVQKYLGLTLLPHSGVSLIFTGIACTTLASQSALAGIVQGTIAAAAVINEIIAVIAAKQGFTLAGERADTRLNAGGSRHTS
ncbi:MAG: cation:proton antiporter [Anaerovoracaceae bacterium]|jgi:Kef-type K+ transport system membrane component KefB